MPAVERAAATDPGRLRRGGLPAGEFGRWYFGDEFCMHLLPTVPELRRFLALAAPAAVTLVCPPVTGPELRRFLDALAWARGAAPGRVGEAVLNDFGALRACARQGKVRLRLGRVLSPSLANMEAPALGRFMREFVVSGMEADERATAVKLLRRKVPVAWHLGREFASMTRVCPDAGGIVSSCGRPCGAWHRLVPPGGLGPLDRCGNAYYRPGQAPAAGVSRTVEHPDA